MSHLHSRRDRRGSSPRLRDAGLPLAVLAAALGAYLATLAPGLTWAHSGADGGDLIAAARTLGVAHPPGYPLYLLLGKLFTWLPVGNVAYRLNLLSAVCAAGAASLLVLWVRAALREGQTRCETAAAWMAAGLLAFSRLYWSQAVIAEVYALNALLAMACLWLWWRWTRRPERAAPLIEGALLLGLGLGNHLTLILLALPCAVDVLARRERRPGWRQIGAALLAFLLGAAIYLYLPLRARGHPPINWGDPSTWRGFWWMVSGALYRHYVFALPLSHLPIRLATLAGDLARQFGPWGVALGLLGVWGLARRDRRALLVLGSIVALYAAYAVGYNTADSFVYLLPAYAIWAFWAGLGVAQAGEWLEIEAGKIARRPRYALAALVCALPLVSLGWNWRSVDLRRDREATDYLAAALEEAPPGAIVISASDAHTFALWYAQYGEGLRQDLLVLDRDLLPYAWYRGNTLPRYPDVVAPAEFADPQAWLAGLVAANLPTRAVLLADPDERLLAQYAAEPAGPLYRLIGERAP